MILHFQSLYPLIYLGKFKLKCKIDCDNELILFINSAAANVCKCLLEICWSKYFHTPSLRKAVQHTLAPLAFIRAKIVTEKRNQ
jgi:hypothetical protein